MFLLLEPNFILKVFIFLNEFILIVGEIFVHFLENALICAQEAFVFFLLLDSLVGEFVVDLYLPVFFEF